MSLQHGERGDDTIVNIQNYDQDLYHLSLVHLGEGGSVYGYGMGRPLLEIVEEGKARLVRSGVIASINAAPLHRLDSETHAPEYTDSIDFITPQGVVGSGLALFALSRSVERSVANGHTEHRVPTWQRLQDLSLSVLAVDTEVRQQAHSNPSYTPNASAKLELIPPKIPSHPNDAIDVGLYVDDRNKMTIVPTKTSIEVGKISFSVREQDGLPIDEVFSRADWHIASSPFSGYLLQVVTGSNVRRVETDAVVIPDNVRHIAASYGLSS